MHLAHVFITVRQSVPVHNAERSLDLATEVSGQLDASTDLPPGAYGTHLVGDLVAPNAFWMLDKTNLSSC
jgi:hypothetical protein